MNLVAPSAQMAYNTTKVRFPGRDHDRVHTPVLALSR